MERIVLVGAGGHASVILEILREQEGIQIIGCTASPADIKKDLGIPILGTDSILPDLRAQGVRAAFVALGNNALRMQLVRQVQALGFCLVNAISPYAVLSPSCRLGKGVAVMPGAVINAHVRIGDGCIINTNASVDHDCVLHEGVHIAPGCAISGSTCVGEQALLGTGSSVIDGISIGPRSIVGSGAVVVNNLRGDATYVGVPARMVMR